MRAVKGEASPKRGTVRRTALCRWCDEVLYRFPWGWEHDAGDALCDPDVIAEVAAYARGGKED